MCKKYFENTMPELLVKKPSENSKRHSKCIMFVIAMLLLSSACLSGYVYYLIMFRDTETCLTEDCLQAALNLMSTIDPTVDPCNDFYQFTCGNYLKTVAEKNIISRPYVDQERNNQMRKLIVEEISGDEWEPLLLQKRYYQACMNLNEDNNNTFYDLLEELGGWPIIEGQKWVNFNIDKAIIKCRQLGLPADWYFKLYLNEFQNRMEISLPNLNIDLNYPCRESMYFDLMIETAIYFGGSKILAMREMKEALNLEKQLQKIIRTNYYYTYKWTPDELISSFSYFNLYNLLANSTNSEIPSKIILANNQFLNELNLLLAGTSRRTQANYFVWKIIQYFGIHLSSPIREKFVKFHNLHEANENLMNTYSEICLNDAKQRFPYVIEMAYLKQSTEESVTLNVENMLSNIKNTYISRIKKATWIDRDTKYKARNKLENIFELIGYRNVDYHNLPNIFEFTFTSSNIIEIIREINRYNYAIHHGLEVVKRIDKYSEAIMQNTLTANAAYIDIMNMIIIGVPILQKTFFSKNRPYYLNYGSLGTIVSRQIAHGFYLDALSHETDFEGTVMNEFFTNPQAIREQFSVDKDLLWTNKTYDEVYARVTCIDEQLYNFGEMVKNDVISSKNFADVLGTELAYESYQNWVKQNYKEQKLPGLPFTANQLFWLEFGSQFCYKKIEDNTWNNPQVIDTPLKYRMMNTLKNSPSFANDFGCRTDSEMNPINKCYIF